MGGYSTSKLARMMDAWAETSPVCFCSEISSCSSSDKAAKTPNTSLPAVPVVSMIAPFPGPRVR